MFLSAARSWSTSHLVPPCDVETSQHYITDGKPNKMSHSSRFKATVGASSKRLSSVLMADIECWTSGVSALHPPACSRSNSLWVCSTTAFHSKSSKSHFSPVKGHRMHDLNYSPSFKIQEIVKKEWEESGSHRLCLFFFFSTKIQVSCRFCHFSQQSTKHGNQFGSTRRLHNFRQRGIFTEVSYVQVSNGYINSEGSSCGYMLSHASFRLPTAQLIVSGHKAALFKCQKGK